MGPTPLADALRAFAGEETLRLHMPGHKGRGMPLPELSPAAALDFTELGPTGDLFRGDGPIREAERLWAERAGMAQCLFLTGGSTQGMLAALTLAAGEDGGRGSGRADGGRPCGENGDCGRTAVLLDRGSHRSVYNALALLDLEPVWLGRPWLAGAGVTGPISPQEVEKALENQPNIKTICITSPTYYGVLSDIPVIAQLAHAHGCSLAVDAAHGAHLPFLGNGDLAAADLAVVSAHKTLPALGQSALLFAGDGGRFSHAALRRAAALFGSSSPSYLLMASLDAARAWMEDEGIAAYRAAAAATARLRSRFPSLSPADASLDPCRLVLLSGDGFALQAALEERGVYVEMADRGHVVCILTGADTERDFQRFEEALGEGLGTAPGERARGPMETGPGGCGGKASPPPPPPPARVLSPREARFAPCLSVPLGEALGMVAAEQVAPYPPGVPVIAPGERLEKKHLAYLSEIGYNMEKDILAIRAPLCDGRRRNMRRDSE